MNDYVVKIEEVIRMRIEINVVEVVVTEIYGVVEEVDYEDRNRDLVNETVEGVVIVIIYHGLEVDKVNDLLEHISFLKNDNEIEVIKLQMDFTEVIFKRLGKIITFLVQETVDCSGIIERYLKVVKVVERLWVI